MYSLLDLTYHLSFVLYNIYVCDRIYRLLCTISTNLFSYTYVSFELFLLYLQMHFVCLIWHRSCTICSMLPQQQTRNKTIIPSASSRLSLSVFIFSFPRNCMWHIKFLANLAEGQARVFMWFLCDFHWVSPFDHEPLCKIICSCCCCCSV